MSWTVQDYQIQIANEMDQSATAPTAGGTDWNIRMNALNRSLVDWAESSDWDALKKIYNGKISTSTGNASVSLPSDFSILDGFPKITTDGSTTWDFPVVDPSKNTYYTSSDKFVNILGNDRDSKVMFVHADTLASGASIQFTYWKSPQSLASATDIAEIPDPTFLVQRSLYYLYKGREDGRFPEAKVESDKILVRMIENEATRGISYRDRNISGQLKETNFRIGRD